MLQGCVETVYLSHLPDVLSYLPKLPEYTTRTASSHIPSINVRLCRMRTQQKPASLQETDGLFLLFDFHLRHCYLTGRTGSGRELAAGDVALNAFY